jgi:hypothetical protein
MIVTKMPIARANFVSRIVEVRHASATLKRMPVAKKDPSVTLILSSQTFLLLVLNLMAILEVTALRTLNAILNFAFSACFQLEYARATPRPMLAVKKEPFAPFCHFLRMLLLPVTFQSTLEILVILTLSARPAFAFFQEEGHSILEHANAIPKPILVARKGQPACLIAKVVRLLVSST